MSFFPAEREPIRVDPVSNLLFTNKRDVSHPQGDRVRVRHHQHKQYSTFYMLDRYVCNIILPIPTLTFLPLIFRLKVFDIIVIFYDFHLPCSSLSLRDRDLLINQKHIGFHYLI